MSAVRFCVEGPNRDRLAAFLHHLGMREADQGVIIHADLVVIEAPAASTYRALLINTAIDLGRRVAVIETTDTITGVDAKGVEWFHSIEAFETFLRDESHTGRPLASQAVPA